MVWKLAICALNGKHPSCVLSPRSAHASTRFLSVVSLRLSFPVIRINPDVFPPAERTTFSWMNRVKRTQLQKKRGPCAWRTTDRRVFSHRSLFVRPRGWLTEIGEIREVMTGFEQFLSRKDVRIRHCTKDYFYGRGSLQITCFFLRILIFPLYF